jgi:hypothetical protein
VVEVLVRSIREECLDRLILFGERRLLRVLDEFVEHDHKERNHQGLGKRLDRAGAPVRPGDPRSMQGAVGRGIAVLPPGGLNSARSFGNNGREKLTALSVEPSSSVFFLPARSESTPEAIRRRGSRARTRLAVP